MHRLGRIKVELRQKLARAVLILHEHLLPSGETEGDLPALVDERGKDGDVSDYRSRRDAFARVRRDLARITDLSSVEDIAELEITGAALLDWMRLQTSVEFWRHCEAWQTRDFVLAARTYCQPAESTVPAERVISVRPVATSTVSTTVFATDTQEDESDEARASSSKRPLDQVKSSAPSSAPPTGRVDEAPSLASRLASRAGELSTVLVDGALERTRSAPRAQPAADRRLVDSGGLSGRTSDDGRIEVGGRTIYLPGPRPHVPPVFDLEKALGDLPLFVPPLSVRPPAGAKLRVEIVPTPCRSTGLDLLLDSEVRARVAKTVAAAAGSSCRGCEARLGPEPDCREVFHYDDADRVQTLVSVVALCRTCSGLADLIARAPADGRYIEALEHLMDVNDWDQSTAETYANAVGALAEWRSRHEWTTDLTYLETLCVSVTPEDVERAMAYASSSQSSARAGSG